MSTVITLNGKIRAQIRCSSYQVSSRFGINNFFGLHTTYPHCIKVLFEIGLCHYELLLCWLTKTDYDIWCEELTVIVCFVNGNDVLQKQPTTEATQYLYKLPTNLSPYDINTTSESFTMRQGNCYFKQCLLIKL